MNLSRYQNGKIYKIVSNKTDDVYYGSTCMPLSKRLHKHKVDFSRWKEGKMNYITSFSILEYDDAKIILVKEYPCENKMQLEKKERWYIENKKCVNKVIPNRTMTEYYQDNKETIKNRAYDYYYENREDKIEYAKKYSKNNKIKIKEYKKEYMKLTYVCPCDGKERILNNKSVHEKTKLHLNKINKIKI